LREKTAGREGTVWSQRFREARAALRSGKMDGQEMIEYAGGLLSEKIEAAYEQKRKAYTRALLTGEPDQESARSSDEEFWESQAIYMRRRQRNTAAQSTQSKIRIWYGARK
jgi:hypothetical protein